MTALNLGPTPVPVLVVGAGIMGLGIAQVAAQAGHTVLLFDLRVVSGSRGPGQAVYQSAGHGSQEEIHV